MKSINLLAILFCMIPLISIVGCEKADQTTHVNVANNAQLTYRAGSCDNCEDCCCGFELRNSETITFRVCGFDNGTTTCAPTPPSGCSTISGGFISQQLDSGDPKFAFCMLQGNCFQITNMTLGSSGDIKISCDYDVPTPTFTNVTIPFMSTYTFCVVGTCDVEQCDP